MTPRPRTSRKVQRGYVLLLTLMLIPVAGLAMVGLCRYSMDKAVQANHARQELQRKWTILSVQSSLLGKADQFIEQAQDQSEQPITAVELNLTFGGEQVKLIFHDEQAKANLNTIYGQHGLEDTELAVRRLTQSSAGTFQIQLRPNPSGPSGLSGQLAFGSYGQVFAPAPVPGVTPSVLMGLSQSADRSIGRGISETSSSNVSEVFAIPDAPEKSPVGQFTLWGSGQLNFRRASRQALIEMCQPVLGEEGLQKLLEIRRQHPALGLTSVLNLLELSKEDRTALTRILTDRSSCFALWTVIEVGHRQWRRLAITTSAGPGMSSGGGATIFEW